MSELHLACAARGPYVGHAAAMIHSVLANSPRGAVTVHFLASPDGAGERPTAVAPMVAAAGGSFDLIEVDPDRVRGLPVQPQFTAAMWYRILLPELLPEVDRVLYLDADVIALDDLVPLWETELGDRYLAAVTNVFQHNHVHRPEELGLPASQPYFNSGVLLLNLEAMRADDCGAKLRDFAIANAERIEWPDQDTLNLVLGHSRVALHPRWNCMNSIYNFAAAKEVFGHEAVAEARARPGIRHFEGPGHNKPWHYLCDVPDRERYFEHRAMTPWPECQIEGVSGWNRLRRSGRRLRRGFRPSR